MISKDLFIETMLKLKAFDNKMDKVDKAIKELCPEFGGFYIPEVLDLVMHIFAEIFNDEYEWLGYFVYENDFLNGPEPVRIWTNERPVDIKNWGDVYELLIKNMKEE